MSTGASSGANSPKKTLPSFVVKFGAKSKLRGREIRLWKKKDSPEAPWYMGPQWRGVHYRCCLRTAHRESAALKAEELCCLIWNDEVEKFRAQVEGPKSKVQGAMPQAIATIGAVTPIYASKAPLYQKNKRSRTVEQNLNALYLFVREGLGQPQMDDAAVAACSMTVLTPTLCRRFEEGRLARVLAAPGLSDEERNKKRESALQTVNFYARAVRSIFQPEFLPWYTEDAGLALPDLTGLMKFKFTKPAKPEKVKPARSLLVGTFAAAERWKQEDEPAYMAWLLAAHSLRAGEVARCERSWIVEEEVEDDADLLAAAVKEWVIHTDLGKGNHARKIKLSPAVAEEIIGFWERSSKGRAEGERRFIIPAARPGAQHRADSVLRRARAWMRAQGWETKKLLHEMRAYFLRRRRALYGAAEERALRRTADEAGHRDTRTTTENYTGELSVPGKIVKLPLPGPELNHEGTKAQS